MARNGEQFRSVCRNVVACGGYLLSTAEGMGSSQTASLERYLLQYEGWREAIDDGWSVIATITFHTGETVSFVAEC